MSGSIVDVALGLALVFATFALVTSGINEGIAATLNLRGKMLFGALDDLVESRVTHALDDPPAPDGAGAAALLNAPLLTGLGKKPDQPTVAKTAPSYVPTWLLAAATLDGRAAALAANPPTTTVADDAAVLVDHIGTGSVISAVISSLVESGATKGDQLEAALASWYDGYLDRVSGWYKRKSQVFLIVIGIVVAFAANVDAIGMTRTLLDNPATSATLATSAATAQGCAAPTSSPASPTSTSTTTPATTTPATTTLECATQLAQQLPTAQLGLFWSPKCQPVDQACAALDGWQQRGLFGWQDALLKVVGLLLGGLAISLGAPFWFDLIGRGVALKGTGPTPPPANQTMTAPTLSPPDPPLPPDPPPSAPTTTTASPPVGEAPSSGTGDDDAGPS